MLKYNFFVGIDISKAKLDVCFMEGKTVVDEFIINNQVGTIQKLFKRLKKIKANCNVSNTIVCTENTGVYNNLINRVAVRQNWNLVIESAVHIKRSIGQQRGKNDKVDASRIAEYAYRYRDQLRLWQPLSRNLEAIKALQTERRGLMKAKVLLQQACSEDKRFHTKDIARMKAKRINSPVKAIEKSIIEIDHQIDQLIKSDEELRRLDKLITSVKGVGRQNSVAFLVRTNAFKNLTDPRKYACYAGVVPFDNISGSSLRGRPRVSKQANLAVKSLLQMAAINAKRFDKGLKQYYDRKVSEGKHKMSVLNAIRNKIVHRVFACVRDNRVYQNEYKHVINRNNLTVSLG